MNDRKIEALGRPRRSDAEFSRLLALSRGHHFGKVAGVTESLFAYCDGIALLQQNRVLVWGSTTESYRPPFIGSRGDSDLILVSK
jgi:hypothetical protein